MSAFQDCAPPGTPWPQYLRAFTQGFRHGMGWESPSRPHVKPPVEPDNESGEHSFHSVRAESLEPAHGVQTPCPYGSNNLFAARLASQASLNPVPMPFIPNTSSATGPFPFTSTPAPPHPGPSVPLAPQPPTSPTSSSLRSSVDGLSVLADALRGLQGFLAADHSRPQPPIQVHMPPRSRVKEPMSLMAPIPLSFELSFSNLPSSLVKTHHHLLVTSPRLSMQCHTFEVLRLNGSNLKLSMAITIFLPLLGQPTLSSL